MVRGLSSRRIAVSGVVVLVFLTTGYYWVWHSSYNHIWHQINSLYATMKSDPSLERTRLNPRKSVWPGDALRAHLDYGLLVFVAHPWVLVYL